MAQIKTATDPITFEIVRHRLEYIARQMGGTLEAVGGTVNTTQMHDYMSAIYTADGRVVAVGDSPAMHVSCAAQAVKTIISKFPGDVHPGDVFVLNDPYVAAFHQSDVYVISPIYHEGSIAFWSGSFVHVMDIGARSPGGESPDAKSIYEEGLRIPGVRLVRSGKLCDDIFSMILGSSRQPGMMGLDIKCQLAAHEVVRREVSNTLDEFGRPTVQGVAEELIDYSASEMAARLLQMQDGVWTEYAEVTQPGIGHWEVHLRLEKHADTLTFDFAGTDRQAEIGINLPRHATMGGCFEGVLHGLAYDLPKNEGIFRVIRLITPESSVVSANVPAPVSMNTTSGAAVVKSAVKAALARMLGSNAAWRDELVPPDPGGRRLRTAGVNQNGEFYASSLAQPALSGGGAKSSRDGIDSSPGGAKIAPNVEWMEMKCPLLFLYRRHARDGAGPGRHRGGAGAELAFTPHGISHTLTGVAYGVVGDAGRGFAGGFPGAPSTVSVRSGTRFAEELTRGKLPFEPDELGGAVEELGYSEFKIRTGDVVYYRLGQGGGFGDPLERDPESVAHDCEKGILSRAAARELYGVAMSDALAVDAHATELARAAIRAERLSAAAVPSADSPEWISLEVQGVVTGGEASGSLSCRGCGASLTAGSTAWRWIRTGSDSRVTAESASGAMLTAICGGCGRALASEREQARHGDAA